MFKKKSQSPLNIGAFLQRCIFSNYVPQGRVSIPSEYRGIPTTEGTVAYYMGNNLVSIPSEYRGIPTILRFRAVLRNLRDVVSIPSEYRGIPTL